MELALSQEDTGIKLFVCGIKWEELIAGFKRDETVLVDCFEIMINNNFMLEDRGLDDYFLTLTLPKTIGPLAKLKEQIISRNPLEQMENIDETKLKESFSLLVKEGLSLPQIWKKYVQKCLPYEEPIEVNLGNEEIHIESFDIHFDANSYCVTFQNKEKLIDFLRDTHLTIPRKATEELEIAAQEGKPYATEGLKAAFEEAGIIDRVSNFVYLDDNDSDKKKLSKEFALSPENTSMKLYFRGISWKDFLPVFGDEIVDVFELSVSGPDKFPSNDEYFEVEELTETKWLNFRRRKLSFKELVARVSSLKGNENVNDPFFNSDIGNGNFEMSFTFEESCCILTFWQKDKLLHFLERMGDLISQPARTELKNAINEGKPYCTEGLRQDFERASNHQRIERLMTLIKNYWIPSEEEEFKKALAIVTNCMPSQLGHEPSPKNENSGGHRYGPHLLIYLRLKRERMDCFDGEGNVYGFNGETVIRNIIECYGTGKHPLREYVNYMQTLLDEYLAKFHFYT